MHRSRKHFAFTLVDLLVILFVTALLVLVVGPAVMSHARESSGRLRCASNLRQITLAAIMYAQDAVPGRPGAFPRNTFDPASADRPRYYTGANVPQKTAGVRTSVAGPEPNDVTAAFYFLMLSTDLTPDAFICDDGTAELTRFDVLKSGNFAGPQQNSYSFMNPYPSAAALADGWKFDTTLTPDNPFAADMNYGDNPQGGPTKVSYTSRLSEMRTANSANHWFEGQQVAYADGHVEWQTTPFCGAITKGQPFRDNIYANAAGVDPISGRGGTVHGAPQSAADAVLLPTAFDGPPGSIPVVARLPGMKAPVKSSSYSKIVIGLSAVVLILVVWVIIRTRRNRTPTEPV